MWGSSGGGVSLIAPSDDCKSTAHQLKHVMVILGIFLTATAVYVFMYATVIKIGLWPVFMTLLLGVGYWSIRDESGYKPTWMLYFVYISSMCVVVSTVYALQCALSVDALISILLGLSSLSSIVVARLAWQTYKEMLRCVPLDVPLAVSSLPVYAAGPQSSAAASQSNLTIPNPWASSSNSAAAKPAGFTPFGGQGQRLDS
eukprot:GHVQ01024217.1.p1 GENE.GHVQ01024217.1~~GHVQ01024217.1.p1  ORF type:complete len:201 (+),score=11.01 GHVQ01024217.1:412-1014(+)